MVACVCNPRPWKAEAGGITGSWSAVIKQWDLASKNFKIHNIASGKGCVFASSGSMLDGANVLSVLRIQPCNHTLCSRARFWWIEGLGTAELFCGLIRQEWLASTLISPRFQDRNQTNTRGCGLVSKVFSSLPKARVWSLVPHEQGLMAHTCDPSRPDAGVPDIHSHPGLHSEFQGVLR